MTEEEFHPWLAELGAYAVGALEPDEAEALRRHLADCPVCQAEFETLTTAAGLLAAVPAEAFVTSVESGTESAAGAADPAMWERLRARAGIVDAPSAPPAPLRLSPQPPRRPARSRLRWPTRAGASAALSGTLVAVAATGVFVGVEASGGTPAAPPAASVSAVNSTNGVSGTVQYTPTSWGSSVQLTLKGVPAGDDCVMYAVDGSGNRSVAGSWWVPDYGSQTVPGGVSMQASNIRQFVVETTSGSVLLTVPVS